MVNNNNSIAIACASGGFKAIDVDLKELGVDVFQATPKGLSAAYQHGLDKGKEFLASLNK